jgi:hypothetical protein
MNIPKIQQCVLVLLCLFFSSPLIYCQTNSQPLNDNEKRQILTQLYELQSCRETITKYDTYVSRDLEQDVREKQNYERSLDLEKQATALAQKERDLATDKATFYEQAYKSLTKKPGFGCWMKRIFTLGIARCN